MNISFGQKIPVYQTQILDKKSNQFQKATLFELDCKDEDDLNYVIYQHDAWEYKYNITVDMYEKRSKIKKFPDISFFDKLKLQNNKFYVLENENQEMLGLCETTGFNNNFNIQYLESNRTQKEKYKYIGQSILAGISKYILSSGNSEPVLSVNDPSFYAKDFYTKKCRFSPTNNGTLIMDKSSLESFVSDVEQRTKSPIIDLKA